MFDKGELRRKLMARLSEQKQTFATRSMHLLERPLEAGMELAIGPHKYPVDEEAFLVVIDEAPGAFWTHPVRYELHDVKTGEVRVIQEEFPLEHTDLQAELVALHIPDLPHLKKRMTWTR